MYVGIKLPSFIKMMLTVDDLGFTVPVIFTRTFPALCFVVWFIMQLDRQ